MSNICPLFQRYWYTGTSSLMFNLDFFYTLPTVSWKEILLLSMLYEFYCSCVKNQQACKAKQQLSLYQQKYVWINTLLLWVCRVLFFFPASRLAKWLTLSIKNLHVDIIRGILCQPQHNSTNPIRNHPMLTLQPWCAKDMTLQHGIFLLLLFPRLKSVNANTTSMVYQRHDISTWHLLSVIIPHQESLNANTASMVHRDMTL